MGWVVSSTSRPHFTPGKDPVPILQEDGRAPGPIWKGGKSRPHWDSILDRPARSQSLYRLSYPVHYLCVDSSWNVMAHADAREGKWRGNWLMEWVASTFHTTSELGVSSITTADAHNSAASSRLNWRPRRFQWTRPFRRKMKSGFCECHHISICLYHRIIAINSMNRLVIVMKTHCLSDDEGKELLIACCLK